MTTYVTTEDTPCDVCGSVDMMRVTLENGAWLCDQCFSAPAEMRQELADLRLLRDVAQRFGVQDMVEHLDKSIEDIAKKMAEVGL